MIRASIDIGSNSVLLLVAKIENGKIQVLDSRSAVTALGKNLDQTQEFSPQSQEDTFKALEEFCQTLNRWTVKPNQVCVTATEAARVAKNADVFFKKINARLGLQVQLLDGEGEAYYSALGVCSAGQWPNSFLAIDIGGASTELIQISPHPFAIRESISLAVGSVRATDWLSQGTWGAHWTKCEKSISDFLRGQQFPLIVGLAGTWTSLAAMVLGLSHYDDALVEDKQLDFALLENLHSQTQSWGPSQYLEKYPYLQKRSQAIGGGLHLSVSLGRAIGVEQVRISTRGLRYGTVLHPELNPQFVLKKF